MRSRSVLPPVKSASAKGCANAIDIQLPVAGVTTSLNLNIRPRLRISVGSIDVRGIRDSGHFAPAPRVLARIEHLARFYPSMSSTRAETARPLYLWPRSASARTLPMGSSEPDLDAGVAPWRRKMAAWGAQLLRSSGRHPSPVPRNYRKKRVRMPHQIPTGFLEFRTSHGIREPWLTRNRYRRRLCKRG